MIINFERANDPNCSHLFCLIDKGIESKEKYSGLAHVTEHACLIEQRALTPTLDHFQWGFTCLSHMCLFYSSFSDTRWINKTKELLYSGEIITRSGVQKAKHDVAEECNLMSAKTQERERVVRFVTENRIKYFAMGDPHEIRKIRYYDVRDYLSEILSENKLYLINFRDKFDVEDYFDKRINTISQINPGSFTENTDYDEYLDLRDDIQQHCCLEVFIQLPNAIDKDMYLAKAFIESFLPDILQESILHEVSFNEKFFSRLEKYMVINIMNVEHSKIRTAINAINESFCSFLSKIDLVESMAAFMDLVKQSENDESAYDCLNKYKNYIVFGKPIFTKEVICNSSITEELLYNALTYFKNQRLKIVIR